MYVTKPINLSLLRVINEYKEINYNDLKDKWIIPTPRGVVSSHNLIDNDLKTLEEEGKITIKDNTIKFITF